MGITYDCRRNTRMAKPDIELSDGQLTIEISKGNKQWVARITGTDSKYGLDRDFVSPYGTGTSTVSVSDGEVIEVAWDSHSGKAKGRDYYQVRDGKLERISRNRGADAQGSPDLSPVEAAVA